ncbi:hypothetical protein GCM10020255_104240 [Rhodococcus baikonurensis]
MTDPMEYDLVVIGSGPGGQKAAIAAAKLGKRVAMVEKGNMLGECASTPAPFRRRRCARRFSTSPG